MGQGLGITAEQQQRVVKNYRRCYQCLLRTNLLSGSARLHCPRQDSLFANDTSANCARREILMVGLLPCAVLRSLAPVVRYEAVIPRVDRRRAQSRSLVGRGKSGAGSQQRRALGVSLVRLF